MANYSIEDIEMLRKKSGLTYQEAVALLDYHNGSLAQALIDLEKNGKLKEESASAEGKEGTRSMNQSDNGRDFKEKALNLLHKLYRNRIKIHKNDTTVVNISVLFAGACVLFAPHLSIAGFLISLLLGYKFSFSRMDPAFAAERLDKMVQNAAQNAKSSVSSVVQSVTGEIRKPADHPKAAPAENKEAMKSQEAPAAEKSAANTDPADSYMAENLKKQTEEIENTLDSFFQSSPESEQFRSAYSAAASSVPTIQVPVQKETRDGTVQIDDDHDGYSTVTIG